MAARVDNPAAVSLRVYRYTLQDLRKTERFMWGHGFARQTYIIILSMPYIYIYIFTSRKRAFSVLGLPTQARSCCLFFLSLSLRYDAGRFKNMGQIQRLCGRLACERPAVPHEKHVALAHFPSAAPRWTFQGGMRGPKQRGRWQPPRAVEHSQMRARGELLVDLRLCHDIGDPHPEPCREARLKEKPASHGIANFKPAHAEQDYIQAICIYICMYYIYI